MRPSEVWTLPSRMWVMPSLRAVEVIALTVLAALTLIQWFGVRYGGWAQDLTSLPKALAYLLLIAACFWLGGRNPAATTMECARCSPASRPP